MQALPQAACPSDIAVAKVDLHPAYIAKSFFPTILLGQAGLTPVGSRTVRVRPRNDLRKKALAPIERMLEMSKGVDPYSQTAPPSL